jgi:hypothetical protein
MFRIKYILLNFNIIVNFQQTLFITPVQVYLA